MPLIAAGQFCATANIAQNLAKCQVLVKKAVKAGAKALFLPEASDYITTTSASSLNLVQPVERSDFVQGLCASAKSNNLSICVGIHEPSTTSELVKNTCIWIDQHGNIAQRYQKIHMFDVDIAGGPILKESNSVERGKEILKPFDTGIGKLGMLICFDLRFPEPSLQLRRLGAEIISYPSAFTIPTGKAGHWSILLRARAIETQSYIIAAAQVGTHDNEGKRASYGHAMIVSPWGDVLGECGGDDQEGGEICIGKIDLQRLEKVRTEVPLSRRTDIYPEI